ncbi:MAG TPA: SDR family oxidoreductase [Thermoleophilaceae bacterium]|jgi:3-oxoacyl-[acyl-carrier protein] reductase
MRLEGKTLMVTGAGTGYGAEIAVCAAREGARVVVHYRSSREGAERTGERVREAGSEAFLVQGDIAAGWDEVRRMADDAFGQAGRVDALVNNVGDMAADQTSWRELTEASIDHVLAVDIKGTMLMTHEFGLRMIDHGGGSITNIGSTVIVRGSARAPQYAAGKYGVLGITKSYAAALAPSVRVNTFAPGFMQTERILNRADWKAGRGEKLTAATPMGRIPPPEDMAAAALFLSTDDAAHMTGVYMVADGGYNMIGA